MAICYKKGQVNYFRICSKLAISKTIWEGRIGDAIEMLNEIFPNFTKENKVLRKTLYI